jgi:transposase
MQPSPSFVDPSLSAIDWSIRNGDWLRRAPGRFGGPGQHKEWLHFCVYGERVDVLINFSVVDEVRDGVPRPSSQRYEEHARLTLLVREREWLGEVQSFLPDEVAVRGGDIDLVFGRSSVRFERGRYRLDARSRDGNVHAEVELTPVTMPSIVHNVQYGSGPPINWLVVPRLVASGLIRIGANTHDLDGALAYHDHNWGHFGWGCDFAWEWGYGLPDDPANPWSLVFVRLSDRALTRTMMQGVFLWCGPREQRVFRDRELTVGHRGLRRAPTICKLPPIMGMIHPDLATDVPIELTFDGEGDGDGDFVRGRFTTGEVAQVVLPNDRDLGVTVINEVSGELAVEGRVRGEEVRIDGRAVFEFLGR